MTQCSCSHVSFFGLQSTYQTTADSLLSCVDWWRKRKIPADLKPIEMVANGYPLHLEKYTVGDFPCISTCSIQIPTCIKFGHLSNNVFKRLVSPKMLASVELRYDKSKCIDIYYAPGCLSFFYSMISRF